MPRGRVTRILRSGATVLMMAGLTLTASGSAWAAPASSGAASGRAADDRGCWTSFTSEYQIYLNCDDKHAVYVCPGYVYKGVKHEIYDFDRHLQAYRGDVNDYVEAVWELSSLPAIPRGAYRTTMFCVD